MANQQARFTYNPRSRRYHDNLTGRFVSEKEVRQAVDVIIDAETARIRSLSQDLVDGKINLAQWQNGVLSILKPLHVAMAIAGNGGMKNTNERDLGFIGSLIKEQYKFLQNFVKDIKTGRQALDGRLVERAALYTQAARGVMEAVRTRAAQQGGLSESRRVLGPADHCPGCIDEALKGWGPIGHNEPIGSLQCASKCRCTMEYR